MKLNIQATPQKFYEDSSNMIGQDNIRGKT